MKRAALALPLILTVVLFSAISAALLVGSAKANGIFDITSLPKITINDDGSIIPETDIISRNGNTYTLTADVFGYVIEIARSSIVFDGAGHAINCTNGDTAGLQLNSVSGVIVKNLKIISRYNSVYLYYCSSCLLTNVKTDGRIYLTDGCSSNTITNSTVKKLDIGLGGANNNLITKNDVKGLFVGGSNNRFYQNNFFFEGSISIFGDNFWDDGSSGNYWGDYLTKYPDALERGDKGIGDTVYIIERDWYSIREFPDAKNIDFRPLMYPWGAPEISLLEMPNATDFESCALNFTVNKPAVWMGYSLDGQETVSITGNVTLGKLSNGLHNVTVYAEDTFGNMGTSNTIRFNIVEKPEQAHFSTPLVIATASGFSVVFVGVGLLLYFKKRKH
jgi:hypothetical protein